MYKIGLFALLIVPISGFALPVHQAAQAGDLPALIALAEEDRACLDQVDEFGHTPLYYAYQSGNIEAIAYLHARLNDGDLLQWEAGAVPAGVGISLVPHQRLINDIIDEVAVLIENPRRDLVVGARLLIELLSTLRRTPSPYLEPALLGLLSRARALTEVFQNANIPVRSRDECRALISDFQSNGVEANVLQFLNKIVDEVHNIRGGAFGAGITLLASLGVDLACGMVTSPFGKRSAYLGLVTRVGMGTLGVHIQGGAWWGRASLLPSGAGYSESAVPPLIGAGYDFINDPPGLKILMIAVGHHISFHQHIVRIRKGPLLARRRNHEVTHELLGIDMAGMYDPRIIAALAAAQDSSPRSIEAVPSTEAEPTDQNDVQERCVVCMEELESSGRTILFCLHRFHNRCIQQWFRTLNKNSCPTCRDARGVLLMGHL